MEAKAAIRIYTARVKTKLTVTIDEKLVSKAKQYARRRGTSLSEVIENALREVSTPPGEKTFSERWSGKFRPAERSDEKYRRLAKKYL